MEKEGNIMSKELNEEELDKVAGGANNTSDYEAWQADLAKSRNPNGFGSTFDEWQELQKVRKERIVYGMGRCPTCGSWKTVWWGGMYQTYSCKECGERGFSYHISLQTYGVKGLSIYRGL